MSLGQLTNTGVLALGTLPGLRRITLSRCPHVCKNGLEVGYLGLLALASFL